VPSVFTWTQSATETPSVRSQRLINRQSNRSASCTTEASNQEVLDETNIGAEEITQTCDYVSLTQNPDHSTKKTVEIQTDRTTFISTQDCGTQANSAPMSHKNFQNDDKGIHFYTGLETFVKFLFVFNTLGAASYQLCYLYGAVEMDVIDQFF